MFSKSGKGKAPCRFDAKALSAKDGSLPIAVDVGRSSVKVVFGAPGSGPMADRTVRFNSVFATGFRPLSSGAVTASGSGMVNASTDTEVLATLVSGKSLAQRGYSELPHTDFPLLFGYTAEKEGDRTLNPMEGALFHELASLAVLYCVARVVRWLSWKGNVSLGINLTYQNSSRQAFYSKALNGKHKVVLYKNDAKRTSEEVSVNVTSVVLLQQGYASVFSLMGSQYFDLNGKVHVVSNADRQAVTQGTGLVIDIGRYTTDFSLVRQLTLVKGKSISSGVQSMIESLKNTAYQQGFSLTEAQVEQALSSGQEFTDVHGKKLNLRKASSSHLSVLSTLVRQEVDSFLDGSPLDWLILCGGGSALLREALLTTYKLPVFPLEPVFANAQGMTALLAG